MAKVVVIGATGHIGSFLVPRLVEAGTRSSRSAAASARPTVPSKLWDAVEQRRSRPRRARGSRRFGPAILATRARHRRRHDLLPARRAPGSSPPRSPAGSATTSRSARSGPTAISIAVPTREDAPKRPFGDYGIQKAATEAFLLQLGARQRLPGDDPAPRPYRRPRLGAAEPGRQLQPGGLRDPRARRAAGAAELRARDRPPRPRRRHRPPRRWPRSTTGAPRPARASTPSRRGALTLRGFAEGMAAWFGQPADLAFLPFEAWGEAAERGRPHRDLGAHRPQPQLLDGEGPPRSSASSRATARSRRCRRRSPRHARPRRPPALTRFRIGRFPYAFHTSSITVQVLVATTGIRTLPRRPPLDCPFRQPAHTPCHPPPRSAIPARPRDQSRRGASWCSRWSTS